MNYGHKCHVCGREDVRLYRPGGEFLRAERIVCNAHFPAGADLICYVPLRADKDGSVWGHTSGPVDAWYAMPDADPNGPTWRTRTEPLGLPGVQ